VVGVLPGQETSVVVLSDTKAAAVVVVADTLAVVLAEGGDSCHTMDSQALHMVDNHTLPTLDNCMETDRTHFLHNNSLFPLPHHQTQSI